MDVSRVEIMLRHLEPCGVRLAPGVGTEDLARLLDEEAPSCADVLLALGEEADPPARYLSDDLWHFDPECIGGGDDYVAIAERFRALARGRLPLEEIRARATPEESWVAFELDGKPYRWEASWDGDWADPEIIEKFAALLDVRSPGRRLTILQLGGQDCWIGCATARELSRLRTLTGLAFSWMLPEDAAQSVVGARPLPAREVSERALTCEHPPDRLGREFKFACGAVVGFFFGFLFSARVLLSAWIDAREDWAIPAIIVGLIGALIAGRLALRT